MGQIINSDSHSVVWDSRDFYLKQSIGTGIYFLMQTMAFCQYLTFAFMMDNIPGTTYSTINFSINILISMTKGAEHILVNAVGFIYIMSETAVPSFSPYNCSEHFRQCRCKRPYFSD